VDSNGRKFRGVKTLEQCPSGSISSVKKKSSNMGEKGEISMKGKNNSEAPKFHWNLQNLFLTGIHVLALVVTLVFHPVVDTNPVRALP
jgi:hypothetical protein